MISSVLEKWVSDPTQIGPGLILEWQAWPDASVHKQIVAEAKCIVEAPQEATMLFRDRLPNAHQRLPLWKHEEFLRIKPIALNAFPPSVRNPSVKDTRLIGEHPEKKLLVITAEKHRAEVGM
jgi:hypothetical protein